MDTNATNSGKWNGIANKATTVVSVLAILVVVMVYFGQKFMMGKRYQFTDKESVNYSGTATEEDAKRLAAVLKSVGYFTGSKEVDVLFKRDEEEGTVASFVLTSKWNDEAIISDFNLIGNAIVEDGLAESLTVKLLDDHLNTKHELKIE